MNGEYAGEGLSSADLIIDAVYSGYKTLNGGMVDPLVPLVGVSRQGGFRYRGTKTFPRLLVLTSNLAEPDWPDELDETTGLFVYYGDNRHPGRLLHDTPRFGNKLLRYVFDCAHTGLRHQVPPILIFTSEGKSRSFRFRGLAVPGHPTIPSANDLVAIWKTAEGQRFQNYRASFTILDVGVISRDWIHSVGSGANDVCAPAAWTSWVKTGVARPLVAPRTHPIRTKTEQLPRDLAETALIEPIRLRYSNDHFGFEKCAGAIAKLLLPDISHLYLTRPWRDGGRDGIGKLRVGKRAASIEVSFALEAKCYSSTNAVGVRDISRLISRIKHREFGILVTTSYIDKQAYTEVVDDGHPVILVTARDIVWLLRQAGYDTPRLVEEWLEGIHEEKD